MAPWTTMTLRAVKITSFVDGAARLPPSRITSAWVKANAGEDGALRDRSAVGESCCHRDPLDGIQRERSLAPFADIDAGEPAAGLVVPAVAGLRIHQGERCAGGSRQIHSVALPLIWAQQADHRLQMAYGLLD